MVLGAYSPLQAGVPDDYSSDFPTLQKENHSMQPSNTIRPSRCGNYRKPISEALVPVLEAIEAEVRSREPLIGQDAFENLVHKFERDSMLLRIEASSMDLSLYFVESTSAAR